MLVSKEAVRLRKLVKPRRPRRRRCTGTLPPVRIRGERASAPDADSDSDSTYVPFTRSASFGIHSEEKAPEEYGDDSPPGAFP